MYVIQLQGKRVIPLLFILLKPEVALKLNSILYEKNVIGSKLQLMSYRIELKYSSLLSTAPAVTWKDWAESSFYVTLDTMLTILAQLKYYTWFTWPCNCLLSMRPASSLCFLSLQCMSRRHLMFQLPPTHLSLTLRHSGHLHTLLAISQSHLYPSLSHSWMTVNRLLHAL